jgi:undecaprenyl pyrophosphate phosphatase UppP
MPSGTLLLGFGARGRMPTDKRGLCGWGAWKKNHDRLLKMAGSVLTVAVATLRKTVTVVLSYLIFPKELRTQHVVSFAAVAAGLVLYEVTTQLKKRKEAASAPAQRARVAPPVDEEVAAR